MGIIDVNLEKPAFKRASGTDEPADEPEPADQEQASTPRRGRRLLKTFGAITIGLLGMVTFRKLRGRGEPGEVTPE